MASCGCVLRKTVQLGLKLPTVTFSSRNSVAMNILLKPSSSITLKAYLLTSWRRPAQTYNVGPQSSTWMQLAQQNLYLQHRRHGHPNVAVKQQSHGHLHGQHLPRDNGLLHKCFGSSHVNQQPLTHSSIPLTSAMKSSPAIQSSPTMKSSPAIQSSPTMKSTPAIQSSTTMRSTPAMQNPGHNYA